MSGNGLILPSRFAGQEDDNVVRALRECLRTARAAQAGTLVFVVGIGPPSTTATIGGAFTGRQILAALPLAFKVAADACGLYASPKAAPIARGVREGLLTLAKAAVKAHQIDGGVAPVEEPPAGPDAAPLVPEAPAAAPETVPGPERLPPPCDVDGCPEPGARDVVGADLCDPHADAALGPAVPPPAEEPRNLPPPGGGL